MNTSLSGACLCGHVRYTTSATPVFSGNCHCRDCQRASGAAYAPTWLVPEQAVTVSGAVKYHESRADSGNKVYRGFCPNCGSQLFGRLELMPGMLGIRAGSLDDPSAFAPALDFYTASAAPWDHMNPALPKFAHAPVPNRA